MTDTRLIRLRVELYAAAQTLKGGAPDRDLDWLVASCPSVEHALAFEPTPWMQRDVGDYLTERPSAAKGRP